MAKTSSYNVLIIVIAFYKFEDFKVFNLLIHVIVIYLYISFGRSLIFILCMAEMVKAFWKLRPIKSNTMGACSLDHGKFSRVIYSHTFNEDLILYYCHSLIKYWQQGNEVSSGKCTPGILILVCFYQVGETRLYKSATVR